MTSSAATFAFGGIPDNTKVINKQSLAELRELLNQVKGIKELRGSGLSMVETKSGQSFVISNNGRYVIHEPQIIDTWNGTVIEGVDDMNDLDRVNLSLLKINLNELSSFVFGKISGPETVIFIDPHCPYCDKLIKQVERLGDKYRFRIVVVPVLSEASQKTAKDLVCMNKQEATKAILSGNFKQLPPPSKVCTEEPIQRALVVFQVFGGNAVPFTILPSGKFIKGFFNNAEKVIDDDVKALNARSSK